MDLNVQAFRLVEQATSEATPNQAKKASSRKGGKGWRGASKVYHLGKTSGDRPQSECSPLAETKTHQHLVVLFIGLQEEETQWLLLQR